jgi:hypothetical protein
MEKFQGVIIEESLTDRDLLNSLTIISTRVSKVTPEHKTPWLTQWTIHTIEVPARDAEVLATKLSTALDSVHAQSWYIDFKSDSRHFVIYPKKVFSIDRAHCSQYAEARAYGVALGIPAQQLDFESP